jgi:hypothetical protein
MIKAAKIPMTKTHRRTFSHLKLGACPETNYVIGFNQWLMTDFLSAEFIRRLRGRGSY